MTGVLVTAYATLIPLFAVVMGTAAYSVREELASALRLHWLHLTLVSALAWPATLVAVILTRYLLPDRTLPVSHVHVIPVDPSLTPKEAWKELCIFGERVTFTGTQADVGWATVECPGECDDDAPCRNIKDPKNLRGLPK